MNLDARIACYEMDTALEKLATLREIDNAYAELDYLRQRLDDNYYYLYTIPYDNIEETKHVLSRMIKTELSMRKLSIFINETETTHPPMSFQEEQRFEEETEVDFYVAQCELLEAVGK